MRRLTLNMTVDIVAFTGFVFLTATGVLVRYILPPGSGRYSSVWGLNRHEWGDVHFWIAIGFLSILALHVFLHWRWVVSVVLRRPREGSWSRFGLGLVGLLALLTLALAPILSPIETTETRLTGPGDSSTSSETDELIRGSMSLREVTNATNIPVEYFIQKLELPPGISAEERLGRLGRVYGFEIEDVRRIVRQYKR